MVLCAFTVVDEGRDGVRFDFVLRVRGAGGRLCKRARTNCCYAGEKGKAGITKENLDAAVKQAVEKARAEMEVNRRNREVVDNGVSPTRPVSRPNSPRPVNVSTRNPRRPFTQQERQELASDLRLVSSKDDDDLDFTTDSNRPAP